ncbi:MAG TPA: Gfo/Idh/MocA family oxidoreductase [Dongiaceae bacterium]|jgi:predicted dehydrogenase|nr:Gfo/Idh/MocA family oxidoreductase [Dongiaceae bacterium]
MAESDTSKLRILVAGVGAFGREHLDRLTARQDVQVVGAADPDPTARTLVSDRYAVAHCEESALQMLQQVSADAIVVATPAASHVEIALQALEQGISVLLEKPVAPDLASASRLADVAARSKARLLPGHVLRFSRDHQKLVEVVQSGRIGRVRYVNSRRYRGEDHAVRYSDVDPVLMTMIHDIDLALWVTQSPFRSARAWRPDTGGFRSITIANAVTTSGVSCDLRAAWTFVDGPLPPDRLEVVGERGSIELEAGQSLFLYADGQKTELSLEAGDDPLANELDAFVSYVRDSRQTPALSIDDAVKGMVLADAVMKSLRLDRAVDLHE